MNVEDILRLKQIESGQKIDILDHERRTLVKRVDQLIKLKSVVPTRRFNDKLHEIIEILET